GDQADPSRPKGSGDPSPGPRPKADALGKRAPPSLRPEGPREPFPTAALQRRANGLATLQAALRCQSLHPGHRPAASALGSVLPARWARRAGLAVLACERSIRRGAALLTSLSSSR